MGPQVYLQISKVIRGCRKVAANYFCTWSPDDPLPLDLWDKSYYSVGRKKNSFVYFDKYLGGRRSL